MSDFLSWAASALRGLADGSNEYSIQQLQQQTQAHTAREVIMWKEMTPEQQRAHPYSIEDVELMSMWMMHNVRYLMYKEMREERERRRWEIAPEQRHSAVVDRGRPIVDDELGRDDVRVPGQLDQQRIGHRVRELHEVRERWERVLVVVAARHPAVEFAVIGRVDEILRLALRARDLAREARHVVHVEPRIRDLVEGLLHASP